MPHFLGWILIGLLAGWVASMVLNRRHGLVVNLVIGLVGAFIGGWLNSRFVHFEAMGYVGSFIVAFAGSVVLLLVLGLVNRRET